MRRRRMGAAAAILMCILLLLTVSGCGYYDEAYYYDDSFGDEVYDDTYDAPNDTAHEDTAKNGEMVTSVSYTGDLSENGNLVRSRLTRDTGSSSAMILIYMNGSDLESDNGLASEDINEILAAPYSEKLNIVIQTMGTRQ